MDPQELLTPRERATLRRLVRAEAHRLGYGTRYFDDGPGRNGEWPRQLRHLRRIAAKLQPVDHETLAGIRRITRGDR